MRDFSKAVAAYAWNEMTDILLAYSAVDENGRMVQRLYQEHFSNQRLLHHSTFVFLNWWLGEFGLLNVNRCN
jgi:hypothetical protein